MEELKQFVLSFADEMKSIKQIVSTLAAEMKSLKQFVSPLKDEMKLLKQAVLPLADDLKSMKNTMSQLLERNSEPHQKVEDGMAVSRLVKPEKSVTNVHDFWQKWCVAISAGRDPQLPPWAASYMPMIRWIQEHTRAKDGDISMVLNDLEWYRLRHNISLDELIERIQTHDTFLHH
jgi:hypothetical protein